MFAIGDKVFYKGRINRFNRLEPQIVRKHINGFVYVQGQAGRFNASSFVKLNGEAKVNEDLMTQLTKKAENSGGGGLCHYALEFDNNHIRFQISDACHARMPFDNAYHPRAQGNNEAVLKSVALNVSVHLNKMAEANKQAYKDFVKYIIQESPWKDAFLPRPIEDVYNSGVYIDITKEYWYCISAAIALRVGHEYPFRLPLFKSIIDLGFSPDVAFVVSQFSYSQGGQEKFVKNTGGHHCINNVDCTTEQFANFFKGVHHSSSGIAYKNANNKSYQIQKLVGSLRQDNKPLFNDVMKACDKYAEERKLGWGSVEYSINLSDLKSLVFVCNYFSKVLK